MTHTYPLFDILPKAGCTFHNELFIFLSLQLANHVLNEMVGQQSCT